MFDHCKLLEFWFLSTVSGVVPSYSSYLLFCADWKLTSHTWDANAGDDGQDRKWAGAQRQSEASCWSTYLHTVCPYQNQMQGEWLQRGEEHRVRQTRACTRTQHTRGHTHTLQGGGAAVITQHDWHIRGDGSCTNKTRWMEILMKKILQKCCWSFFLFFIFFSYQSSLYSF